MSKFCLLGSTGALPVRYVRYGPVQGPEWNFAAAAELVQDVGQCEPVPVLNAYIRLGKTGVGFAACAVQRKHVVALLAAIVRLRRPETERISGSHTRAVEHTTCCWKLH